MLRSKKGISNIIVVVAILTAFFAGLGIFLIKSQSITLFENSENVSSPSPSVVPPTSEPYTKPPTISDDGGGSGASGERLTPIAQKLPEFGGFYLRGNVAFVYLLDTSKLSKAEAIIKQELGSSHPNLLQADFKALQADYSYSQLSNWKWKIEKEIKSDILDLDESDNRIRIGINDLTNSLEVEIKQKLSNLGIPLAAVIIEKSDPIIVN